MSAAVVAINAVRMNWIERLDRLHVARTAFRTLGPEPTSRFVRHRLPFALCLHLFPPGRHESFAMQMFFPDVPQQQSQGHSH
jgi:hypothetical protein